MKSGVYYGWAGLSPSKATSQHPPGSHSNYTLMSKDIYESLLDHEKQTQSHDKGSVYPMVMSIGWNPVYKNTVRSIEVHIMHDFETDFYESHMNLVILAFIRPEYDYVSKDSLIDDIKTDIDVAGKSLARDAYAKFVEDPFLLDFSDKSEVAS